MSAEVRTALAAATNTVVGLHCTPYFRQTTKAGDAMVRMDRSVRDTSGFGFMVSWQVLILLPQDLSTAEKWLDTHMIPLINAISEEMVVTLVTPQQLALDTGSVPIVLIEGTRAT